MQTRQTFSKQERLCSRKLIDELFEKGNSHAAYPVKIIFMPVELQVPFPAQCMFVVPKRNFRKAHDRNLLKRRMRESYRLLKHPFYEMVSGRNTQMCMALIYTSRKEEDFATISRSLLKLLRAVQEKTVKA